jgi:hypothetical protein
MPVAPIIVNILGESTELEASLASAGASIKAFGASATLSFAGVGAAITSAGASIKAFGAEMTAAGVGMSMLITAPIVAFGAAALLSANNVQKAYAIIIAGTGATGDKLSALEKQFDTLAANVPNSFTDTATVLTTVNEKLAQGGYAITDISKKILDVSRMTGESAATLSSDFTAAIENWKIQASGVDAFMNEVYSTAQLARVPVTTILTDLDRYGPVIRSANIPLQDAIPIIGEIEAKGEDATRTFQGMAYAWANVAKMIAAPSKTTADTVDAITASAAKAGIQLKSTGDDLQAVFYGIKNGMISDADAANIFGPRFADNIDKMIRDGTISGEDFIKMTSGMSISIDDVGKRTITFAQAIDEMKNEVEIALAPIGTQMFTAFQQLMPIISGAITLFGDLAGAFGALPTPVADVIFVILGIAAAIGPTLVLVGGLVSAFGSIVTAVGSLVTAIPVAVGIIALLAPVLVVAALAVGALTAIIAPLAAALYLAYTSSAAFRGALSDLGGALGTAASAFSTLGSNIATGLSYIISGNYKAGFAAFTTGFTDMWDTITKIDWGGLGTNLVTQIASGISTNMPKVISALGDFVTDADNTWNVVSTDFTTWAGSVDWGGIGKKISADIVVGITTLTTDAKKVWDTVSKDFTTWVSSVNWAADAKKIPAAIIAGLNDLQKDLTPIWNTIETSFTAWRDSVPWAALATQIPTDISNSIKLSMATIGPVWDYIQISLMNWIQSVNWDSVGTQLGAGLRYAIKLALDSLVGGISDLIPTALITAGQPNLLGVGITAAKNFVGGFQSGLGDLWKLIMDGLEPLAGKIADYMEHDVDWTGIGTFIGTTLGSIIAGLMGQPLAEMGGGGGGGTNNITSTVLAQVNNPSKTGVMPDWSQGQGYSKLQKAADDAGNAMATGFVKGAQDAMAHIDWGTIIKNAIMASVGLGNGIGSPNTITGNPTGLNAFDPATWPGAGALKGGISMPNLSSLDPANWPGAGALKGLSMPNLSSLDPANWPGAGALSGLNLGGLGGGALGRFGGGLAQEGGNIVGGWGGVLGGLENPGGIGNGPLPGATIDLPSKLGALGSIDWGKLTKGGIFDLDQGPLAPLAKADYGTEFGKLTKGGIFDLDQGPLAPLAKTNWGAIPGQVGGALSSGATTVATTITGGAKSIWDFITGGTKEIWTWITGTAKEVWTWITGTAHDIWTYITGGAHDIWSYITGGAHDVWSYITGGAHDIWSYITGGAHDVWSYITGGAHDVWSYITGGARDVWSYITGGARDVWTYITGGARDIWTYITGGARDVWSYITGGARDIWSYITGGAHDVWSYITGGAHDIWNTYITGGAKNLWNDFVSGWPIGIASLITGASIKDFLTGSVPAPSSTPVNQPQQAGAGTTNTMLSAGPGAMPWSGPATTPIPALTGAIFNARQGGIHALLAEAGEAEMVVPQERWGESWTHLVQTLPHFGAGGIVGNVSMPAIPQIPALNSVSELKNYIESAVKNAVGPNYEINVTPDGEAWKREVLQAILELEQFHHLGGGSY